MLTSKQFIMLRPLSLSDDVGVQVDYCTLQVLPVPKMQLKFLDLHVYI